MKTPLYLLAIFVLSLLSISCSSPRFNVVKVNNATTVSEQPGVFYKLSKSVIQVDVVVTKVEKIKGPYAEFASKYLGLSNVIDQNSTNYQLTDIIIRPITIADPDQTYFIELSGKNPGNLENLQLMLSESGVLLNTIGEDQKTESLPSDVFHPEESNVYPDVYKYFSDLNLFEHVDTIIERVNIDTATIEKMIFRRTLVEKTPEQKAKDAADFIMKVKENRLNLISGYQEVNYDKETFTLMNSELEKLENEYQKLFTGLTFTNTLNYHFTYYPKANKKSDTVNLFRFSNLKGVLDTSNMNGEAAVLIIQSQEGNQAISDYVTKKSVMKEHGRGYYYRLPEYADIIIQLGGKSKVQSTLPISQFGVVSWLPATAAGIRFYDHTSGIHSLTIPR